jgi:hypothetical protein
MPSPFNGRWHLAAVEGAIAYYDAIKAPEEYKQKLLKIAESVKADPTVYAEVIAVEGNTFHREVFINGEKKKDSGALEFGVERSANIGDGRPAKITLTKESEHRIVRKEVGDGFTLTSTMEVHGDELILTMTNGTATTTEKYKRG